MPHVPASGALSRRAMLRSLLAASGLAAASALVQACAPAPAPTATPAPAPKPAEAPKPAAPAAPAAPPTPTPAPAPKPVEAPKPTEAPKPAAPTATPVPAAKPATGGAKITGKLQVIQFTDWHPDHNKYVNAEITAWAKEKNYPLDLSFVEGYVGGGNLIQKLTAAVQANDAPDAMMHTLGPNQLRFLGIVEDTDALTKDQIKKYGKAIPGTQRSTFLDDKWWGVPYYARAGGWWVRTKAFNDVGIDPLKDFVDFGVVVEACLKASKPDKELYGWGATANRSGDGETIVQHSIMMWGGQFVDETGQIVVLNKDPYREYALAGLNWVKDLFTNAKWKPMMPPGILSWTDPSNNEAYLAGKILFTSNAGTLFAKAVFDKNPVWQDTYLLPQPKGLGPKARAMAGGDGARWWILKGTKNRDGAAEMIDAMLSKERQIQIFKTSTGYAYPNYEWGWEDPAVTDSEPAKHVTPQWKKVAWDPSGFTGYEWPGPPTPWTQALANANFGTDLFGEIVGGKPVDKALADAHDRAVKVFKEFGAKGA